MEDFILYERKNTLPEKDKLYLEKEKDKLELYLNDVHKKECLFRIEKEEIFFIQTGIETLVQIIVSEILEWFREEITVFPYPDLNLSEIYNYTDKIGCCTDLIKAGSYYEGTKIIFPDEFDFIFVLFKSMNNIVQQIIMSEAQEPLTIIILLFRLIRGLSDFKLADPILLQYCSSSGKRKVSLDKTFGIQQEGPSLKIRFSYENYDRNEKKDINVDVVAAIKVIDKNMTDVLDFTCKRAGFRAEAFSTESYLLIYNNTVNITLTETELHFMKKVLSKEHVKVYKILKYLINGDGDSEQLKEHAILFQEKIFSSYMLKSMIVNHHYTCINSDKTLIGPCVLQVLEDISKYKNTMSFPWITVPQGIQHAMATQSQDAEECQDIDKRYECSILTMPFIQSLTVYLRSMQTSEDSYNYDRYKVEKSASKMCMDDLLKKREFSKLLANIRHQN